MAMGLYYAGVFWVFYLALEPYVRRRWPQSLMGWSRLLTHGWRDPQVGANVLVGIAMGCGFLALGSAGALWRAHLGGIDTSDLSNEELRMAFALYAEGLVISVLAAYGVLCAFFLVRLLLRRDWLAGLVVALLCSLGSYRGTHPLLSAAISATLFAGTILVLTRFGVLPMTVAFYVDILFGSLPATTHLSAWYAASTIASLAITAVLTTWAFYHALAGRKVFREGFLEE